MEKTTTMMKNPDYPDEITNPGYPHDRRNIIDHYRYWDQEDIIDDLALSAYPVNVIAENFAHDFNIATLVRNVNAFNMKAIHMVGRKQWDRRGAVGTHHYTPIFHHSDAEGFYRNLQAEGNPIIVFDNVPGATALPLFSWPEGDISIIFGQETIGVSNLALDYATHTVEIPQRGSVRSLNVGTSSGIVLYDYMIKHEWSC